MWAFSCVFLVFRCVQKASNAPGSSCSTVQSLAADASWPTQNTGQPLPSSSTITWRQSPQGEISATFGAYTSIAWKLLGFSPWQMALNNAVRSAQLVSP